ncbi:MAG: hypothetical protein EOM55_01040 [Clostridia bacterium]|nr:hypothetical protein [Clostridia bacterium]
MIKVDKPQNWPQNQREAKLNNVLYAVKKFQGEPNYANKEIVLSLITEIDPNQHDDFGLMRISDYEIAIINELYFYATILNLAGLKIFLYKEITETTRIFNMLSKFNEKPRNFNDIEKYATLILPLKLFYIAYRNFNYYKERSFCEELLDTINNCEVLVKQGQISLDDIEYAFTNLMFELSNASGINTIPFIEFDRKELLKLFDKEFKLIEKLKKDPLKRPLKGVLKMTISNWILRSRNSYDHSPVFKCLSNTASNSSIKNKEIWMRNIEFLNDKREGKVIKELFSNKKWIKYDWAKNIKLDNPYTLYVTSFSKKYPTDSLKHKYGKNVYGYRSDKIANIVTPIININGFPQFGQTLSYDIIYNRDTAKEEINFLFEIINKLPLDNKGKIIFSNEIIAYWFLSFKDKKWENEYERRYQVFYYDQYPYLELNKDKEYLKIKSTVFLFPDNISKDNNCYDFIKANIFDRYYAIATKEFIQCNDCLNIDYEIFGIENNYICPICGSTNSSKIIPEALRKKHPN